MKVTVCFGNVRVVVPCGDGDILVRDLIREATLRYKKATGKGADSWVSVHNLQSQGGGILDPDDRLSDVADDREQILASFEDGEGAHLHGGGDGASGSSVGTGSPDIFHDGEHKYGPNYPPRTDIEVTGEQIASGVPLLQVRRGSEPTLNQLPAGPPAAPEHTKRWSAAPLILEPPSSGYASPDWMEDSREEEEEPGFRRVARDGSNRLSMQFLGADGAGYRWAEAAERAATARSHVSTSLPRESRRKEPLGQANNSTSPLPSSADGGELIVIRNEPGPLGIHVIPDYDTLGRERGLLVKGIEPGGRIDRDGRLAIYDRVIEINGENLINMPFQRVQELFKLSLTSPELRLKVIKASGLEGLRKPPPPIYPCFPEDKENVSMVECEQKQSTNTKVATVSPTKKVPAISKNLKGLLTANTRKIGRKIEIELVKGPHGLGFSITTRDNPAGGKCPIYIKNINAVGPAIEDGRLRIGDRLLEVNNAEMTGKSQAEAVALLKSLPLGSKVRIVVSRQEDVVDTNLPRIIDVEHSNEREVDRSTDNSNIDVPPNIPPLPQSHLQALQNRTPDKGSVAKIISQFQEAVNNNSATHDTWTSSMLGNSSFGNLTSTTVNMTNVEPILIEDEYGSRVVPHQNQQINVHITNKMSLSNSAVPENRNDHEPDGKASLSGSNGDKSTDTSSQTTIQANDATYASQLSLENPQGFSRDAFGRQSMSEKRHATLDAKSTDTYQRSKKMREERRTKDNADKLGQLGPSLGMKKSSSLESLQTMVQEIQMQEEGDPAYSYRGPSGALKVIRGRGCEESFRAAVVDPNHTSEIGAKKHWLLDGPMENEREIDGFNNVRGAPRQSSLNAALDSKIKSSKKKPGILKGIGSMFRFGKHRKMEFVNAEPVQHYHHSNEFDSNANPAPSQNPPENDTQPHHNDNQSQGSQSERLQEQLQQPPRYSPHQQPPQASLQQQNALQQQQQQNVHHQANSHQQPGVQQQIAHKHHHQSSHQPHSREQQIQREAIYQRHGFVHRHAEQVQVIPENSVAPPPIKYRQNSSEHRRNERDLNKLRMNQQRHTYYQNDERDAHDHRQAHQRSDSRDPQYIEYGRPGSRSGITESIPYTHYVNYKELQSHLSRKDPLSESQIVQMRLQVQQQRLKVEEESRKQHQYHSQRQTRTDNQLRPVSNYYEYESVQSVLNSRSARPNVSHTPQQQPPPIYQDANSNSLPRNQPVVQGRHPTGRGSAHRGPFITQVTIGEQNGTKV